MGKLCLREVKKFTFVAIALVKKPFDKWAIIEVRGKEYDYGPVKLLIDQMQSPFDKFHTEESVCLREEYKNVGRNELCPCGSGKKYKKCCLGTKREQFRHVEVIFDRKMEKKKTRFFSSWK